MIRITCLFQFSLIVPAGKLEFYTLKGAKKYSNHVKRVSTDNENNLNLKHFLPA
jgi:hypothetical protein